MRLKTHLFYRAYEDYYNAISRRLSSGDKVLEVGGGAHPSVANRELIDYTIVDPDKEELSKSPNDIKKINEPLEHITHSGKFDFVISKMVLEHVEEPFEFHKHIFQLLRPGGIAIHFFACRNSFPSIMNRLLPEWIGEKILRILKNRDTLNNPKYKAHYKRTMSHSGSQITFFESLGYQIDEYNSYVGHKYFSNIYILNQLERIYTHLLKLLNMHFFATVALVVLSKPEKSEYV